MRTYIFLFALFALSAFTMPQAIADPIEGIWINNAEDLKVKIESAPLGIRAKRAGSVIWDYYKNAGNNRYRDSDGNMYELQGTNQVVWQDNRSGRRITFIREGTTPSRPRNVPPSRPREREENPRPVPRERDWHDEDDDRYEYDANSRFAHLTGSWFNQKTRHSMWVQSVKNGLRISTGRAKPVLFAPSRDSKVFRSRNGDTLTWLNDHTLQLKTNGKQNLIFHRADETSTKGKGHGHGKAKGHHKAHGHGKAHGHHK